MPLPTLSLAILLTTLLPFARSSCFTPTQAVADEVQKPCGASGMCCALDRQNAPGSNLTAAGDHPKDECMPNGLCRNRWMNEDGDSVVEYFRDACTNQQWDDAVCLTVCGNDASVQVTPCSGSDDSEFWCCGNSAECCGTPAQERLNSTRYATSNGTSPASSSSSLAPTSSSSSTSVPASVPEKHSLAPGALAGVVIGAVLGALAILGLGFLLWRRYNSRSAAERYDMGPSGYSPGVIGQSHVAPYPSKVEYAHVYAADVGGSSPSELPASAVTHELGTK